MKPSATGGGPRRRLGDLPVEEPGPSVDGTDSIGSLAIAGGLWNTLSLLVPQGYTVVVSVVAARVLGPEGMGQQSYIAFVALSLFVILSCGMHHVLLRFVGDVIGRGRPGDVRQLLRWSWWAHGLGAVVGAGVPFAMSLAQPDLAVAWRLAGFICALAVLHAVPASLLRGLQRWREATIMALVTGGAGMVATVAVLAAGGGIAGMFAVEAAVGVVHLAWAQVIARRITLGVIPSGPNRGERFEGLRGDVIRYAVLSTFQGLLYLVVWRRSEFYFLERYSTESEIAMYSVAFAASNAAMQIPQGLAMVLAPAVAHLVGAGAFDRIRSGFARSIRLLILASLPLTAGVVAIGPTIVEQLYGEPYRRAGTVLLVLAAVLPSLPLYFLATSLLYAMGKVRAVLLLSFVATLVNLVLAIALIPRAGAVGAAVANLGAQVTAGILLMLFASRVLGGLRWDVARVAGCALASTGAGLAALGGVRVVAGLPGAIVATLVGVAVFAALAVRLRILSPADAAWLDMQLGHRGKGTVGRVCRRFLPLP